MKNHVITIMKNNVHKWFFFACFYFLHAGNELCNLTPGRHSKPSFSAGNQKCLLWVIFKDAASSAPVSEQNSPCWRSVLYRLPQHNQNECIYGAQQVSENKFSLKTLCYIMSFNYLLLLKLLGETSLPLIVEVLKSNKHSRILLQ